MRLALIAPIKLLGLTGTDYHLILPQLLGNEQYFRYYARAQGHKILDNGEAEGITVTHGQLFKDAEIIKADEIVVPDVIGNCWLTIDRVKGFRSAALHHPEYKYIGVAQGHTLKDVIKCLTFLSLQEWISVLALPRILVNTISPWARASILSRCSTTINDGFEAVHCLGMGKNLLEPEVLAQRPVRGLDTSLPFSLAFRKMDISNSGYEPRPADYFDRDVKWGSEEYKTLVHNIDTLRKWCATNNTKQVPA